jgi:hypothetical protein
VAVLAGPLVAGRRRMESDAFRPLISEVRFIVSLRMADHPPRTQSNVLLPKIRYGTPLQERPS